MPQPVITTVAVFTRLRLFQELLSSFVGSRQGFAVIAVSANELEATRVVIGQRPDVILIDAGLPGVWNVADAAVQAGVRTVVFGLADNPHPIENACRHGCGDALLTSATAQDIVDALEDARRPAPHPVERPVAARDVSTLTSREVEVLALVARGLSNKEIAGELTVSVPTVKTHVHNVLHKLGARRRADAALLLHVAASDAAEARPARHLGVISATDRHERPQRLRVPAG